MPCKTSAALGRASQESALVINRPASRVEIPDPPKIPPVASDTLADRVRSLRLPADREYERAPWRRWLALAVIGVLAAGGGAAFVLLPDRTADPTGQADQAASASPSGSPESSGHAGSGPAAAGPVTKATAVTAPRETAAGEVVLESKGYIIP
ncbi:MAG TPA: hypothetical protein VGG30_05970, partial [Pirellulales bacterium]